MSGFFVVPRGCLDHPVFDDGKEPLCKRAAWLWLVEKARWQPGESRAPGQIISLGRGQLSFALRYIARAWRWCEVKVRRFLKALQAIGTVHLSSDAGMTIITICNYDDYQFRSGIPDADMTQEWRTSDANKDKPLKGYINMPGEHLEQNGLTSEAAADDTQWSLDLGLPAEAPAQASLLPTAEIVALDNVETRFSAFYEAYPRKVGRKRARLAYLKALKVASHDEIMEGLRRFRFSPDVEFRPHPATWLNSERWTDEPSGQTVVQPSAARTAPTAKPSPASAPADLVEAWCSRLPGAKPTTSVNDQKLGRWIFLGEVVDLIVKEVLQASSLVPRRPEDLDPIKGWLEAGLDGETIIKTISKVAEEQARKGEGNIFSLKFFTWSLTGKSAA